MSGSARVPGQSLRAVGQLPGTSRSHSDVAAAASRDRLERGGDVRASHGCRATRQHGWSAGHARAFDGSPTRPDRATRRPQQLRPGRPRSSHPSLREVPLPASGTPQSPVPTTSPRTRVQPLVEWQGRAPTSSRRPYRTAREHRPRHIDRVSRAVEWREHG